MVGGARGIAGSPLALSQFTNNLISNKAIMGLGDVDLHKFLPSFRNPLELYCNERFLIGNNKDQVLKDLKYGLRADWTPVMPHIYPSPCNFFPSPAAVQKCRERFISETQKGRMIGGLGWSLRAVENFLQRRAYTIPCGAVPKNGDPFGRIIHNYSYPLAKEGSINSALMDTAVEYGSFRLRVSQLAQVDWFIKADLVNGYRQLLVHPTD